MRSYMAAGAGPFTGSLHICEHAPQRGWRTVLRRFRGIPMLKYAIIFGLIALVTGALGFRGISGVAATIAKVCFAIFLILFVIAILAVIGVFHLAF